MLAANSTSKSSAHAQQHQRGDAAPVNDRPHGGQPALVDPRGRAPDAIEHRFKLQEDADGGDRQGQQAQRPAHFRLLLDEHENRLQLLGQPGTDLLLEQVEQLLLPLVGVARPFGHQPQHGDQHQAQGKEREGGVIGHGRAEHGAVVAIPAHDARLQGGPDAFSDPGQHRFHLPRYGRRSQWPGTTAAREAWPHRVITVSSPKSEP